MHHTLSKALAPCLAFCSANPNTAVSQRRLYIGANPTGQTVVTLDRT
jgi:hypothetical protein